MLKLLKKSAISKSIEKFLTSYLERKKLGKVSHFKLDTKKKNIHLTLLLKRENQPLEIVVSNYSFVKEKEKLYFKFDSITTSRDWNSKSFERLISNEDKKIEIPSKYVKMIEIFIDFN